MGRSRGGRTPGPFSFRPDLRGRNEDLDLLPLGYYSGNPWRVPASGLTTQGGAPGGSETDLEEGLALTGRIVWQATTPITLPVSMIKTPGRERGPAFRIVEAEREKPGLFSGTLKPGPGGVPAWFRS